MRIVLDVIGAAVIGYFALGFAIYTGWLRLCAAVAAFLICAMVYFTF
jgi:hypothetical protein